VEGWLLVGFAIAVMQEARKFRAPPRHVWAIAISYMALIAGYMAEVYGRRGDDWGWRTFLALASFTFGLYAMWLMWTAYKYVARMKRHERKQIVAANRLMGQAFGHALDEDKP